MTDLPQIHSPAFAPSATANEAGKRLSARQLIGFGLAMFGVVAAGACGPEGSGAAAPSQNPSHGAPTGSPEVPAPLPGPELQRVSPATAGTIGFNVVIATVEGDTTSRGFTPENTKSITQAGQSKLARATDNKLTFAPPAFWGKVTVSVPSAADRCKTDSEQLLDSTFREEFTQAVTKKVVTDGMNIGARNSAGLIIYADFDCQNPIRSSAHVGFNPRHNALITNDPEVLANEGDTTLAHEQGHLLGLSHANAYECPDGALGILVAKCTPKEYGSSRSVMGYEWVANEPGGKLDYSIHLNAYELARLGALTPGQIRSIETDGEYDVELTALHPSRNGAQVIRIPREPLLGEDPAKTDRYYWLELSPGARDIQSKAGCEEVDYLLQNCDYPYTLSVALYTADNGQEKVSTPSALVPLSGLNRYRSPAMGGAGETQEGTVIFRDPATGLVITLIDIEDNANTTGSAKLHISLKPPSTEPPHKGGPE